MIELVVNNTKPDIVLELQRGGKPFPLSENHTVTLKLLKASGVVTVNLTVTDVALAIAEGNFGVGDLSQAGEFYAEVVVDDGSGGVQNSKSPVKVVVRPEFAEVLR